MTKLELAEMLELFVGDRPDCGPWEFDDFTAIPASPELESYRRHLVAMEPPFDSDEIRVMVHELRSGASA